MIITYYVMLMLYIYNAVKLRGVFMINNLEHKFTIKRIFKTTDEDYIKALHIYNDTTPFEIKTPTNEITYWLEKQSISTPFEIFAFILYLNDEVIGFSMTTYIKKSKIVIDEYLAVYDSYRIQTIFLAYESLIQNFYRENGIDVSYYITEISNKADGKEMDRESRISLKLMCIEDYGKINALYFALPLGLENHESNFNAHLYIKGVEQLQSITRQTYQEIIESMYYDYWYTWYSPIMSRAELEIYKKHIDNNFQQIKNSIIVNDNSLPIMYSNCNELECYADVSKNVIPTKKDNSKIVYLMIIPIIILLPLLIILLYSEVLNLFGLSVSSLSSMIGAVISAIITTLTSLFIAKKK